MDYLAPMDADHISLAPRDPAAVAASEEAKATIQMAYMLARAQPREVMAARSKILDACKRPGFAEKAEYRRPVGGGKTATGASIRFAEEMVRCWRNVMVRQTVVYEDDTVRRVMVTAIDLENNIMLPLEIVVPKIVERRSVPKDRHVLRTRTNSTGDTVYVVEATPDEVNVSVASQASRAFRNGVMRLFPSDVVEEAMEACRATMRNTTAKDPQAAVKKLVDRFSDYGVTPSHLAKFLGHPVDGATVDELEELRAAGVAMSSEGVTWAEIMVAKHGAAEDQANSAFQERATNKVNELKDRVAAGDGGKRGKRGSRAADPQVTEATPAPAAVVEHPNLGDLTLDAQKWIRNDGDRDTVATIVEAQDALALDKWIRERVASGDEASSDPASGLFD